MYLSRIILLTACTLTMTGCSNIQRGFSNFFFPPNAYSDRRDGESVKIQLHNDKSRKELETDLSERKKACTVALQQDSIFLSEHKSEIDKSSKEDVAKFECESKFVAIPPPLVAAAATAALGEVQKFLKAEAERYSASYSAAVANDTFYDSWAPGAKINLKGLTVQRKVGTKAQKDMGMELCMAVEPTLDGSAFRLYPIYAQVHRAKAKLIAFDWLAPLGFDLLAPWTVFSSDTRGYDNDVDLKVEISLHGIWVDGKPEMHNQLLAKEEIKLGS